MTTSTAVDSGGGQRIAGSGHRVAPSRYFGCAFLLLLYVISDDVVQPCQVWEQQPGSPISTSPAVSGYSFVFCLAVITNIVLKERLDADFPLASGVKARPTVGARGL